MIDVSETVTAALADWGETVTIGGQPATVIFEEPGETVSPLTGEIQTTAPQISGLTSVLGSVAQGTAVVRGGVTYYVVSPPKNDGLGGTTLILSRDP